MQRILLVEDENDIRVLYAEYLRDRGYVVIEAPDGDSGMQKALSEEWDLMLLDIVLPGQDGVQLLKTIKSNEKIKDKPVIVLTNVNIESVLNEVFRLGADGFLVKSEITPEKIVSEIQAVWQKYS
jgi:two-component system response regulator ResD